MIIHYILFRLEGVFIGDRSSHARMEEGSYLNENPLSTIRISSFKKFGPHSSYIRTNKLPDGAVGWFRYRSLTTSRVSVNEICKHMKLSKNGKLVFCLLWKEDKGDVSLTSALNLAFYEIKSDRHNISKCVVTPVQMMITNPDDVHQPAYPCYQIDNTFSVAWPSGFSKGSSSSPRSDPSEALLGYTRNSFQTMLDQLSKLSNKIEKEDNLMDI